MSDKSGIDLFGGKPNYRWQDQDHAELLNIVFQGGTFGHNLQYLVEKYSNKTPNVLIDPYTESGTSHRKINYSGMVEIYHPSFINVNVGKTDLPICQIVPNSEKAFQYLRTGQWYRSHDTKARPDEMWQNKISEQKKYQSIDVKGTVEKILETYAIKGDKIPKFIVRDFYKKEMLLKLADQYNHQYFDAFRNHKFFQSQKTFHFPMEAWFDFDLMIKELSSLNDYFDLGMDMARTEELKKDFELGYELDVYRKQVEVVFRLIENLKTTRNMDIPSLDVANEAFIYATIEKENDFVIAPLTNSFFKDTDEIREYIENYPEHYKAMNPNLQKFNGKDNPFYLWRAGKLD